MKAIIFLGIFITCFLTYISAEDKCEVCIKIMNDLKAKIKKNKKKNLSESEIAQLVDDHCNNKKLPQHEKSACYNLLPVKTAVARQVKLGVMGKSSLSICEELDKSNQVLCSIKGPMKLDKDYSEMKVKELKRLLSERGVECVGCAEKSDFVKRARETETLHTDL